MTIIRKCRSVIFLRAASLSVVTMFMSNFAQSSEGSMSRDLDILTELNQNYLVSYRTGDVEWFDENLTEDFRETAPSGILLDKAQFLRKIEQRAGGDDQGVRAAELEIRLFGDLAIVHAMPEIFLPDGGSLKGGRYTDVYSRIDGRWLCVTAHLGGS